MNPYKFEDLTINIFAEEPPSGGSNVSIAYSKGIRTGTFSLSSVALAVANLNAAMYEAQPAQAVLEAGGHALFEALFAGQAGNALREGLTLAEEHQHGLRLRIYSDIASIIAIPWEYLYDVQQGRWLTLDSTFSLVRALPVAAVDPPSVEEALRILIMSATPTNLSRLDSERELSTLEEALDTSAIEIIHVEPTYEALLSALRQHKPHVFHFIGHGAFAPDEQESRSEQVRNLFPVESSSNGQDNRVQGCLAFCKADGTADLIPADKVAILLAGCKTLRLVLLNACQGAVTGKHAPFAGVAQQLLRQGMPAVLAMQAPIYDEHALRFSQEFYRALADGLGVEQAICEGRKRINEVAYTWGIPTFYFQGTEPFVVTPLNDTQKAERLWPKVQALLRLPTKREQSSTDRLRSLLNQILSLDANHSDAQKSLQQLDNQVKAARLYTEGVAYKNKEQWQEAYQALQQVEQLWPNYLDTRWLLAEVLGKLHQMPTPQPDERRRQLQPILNALMEGRFVPFLGWDAACFGRPPNNHWLKGLYPPDADEIASELQARLSVSVEGVPSLAQVSQLTSLLEDEVALYERLYDLYEQTYPPPMLHMLLAEMSSRLHAKNYPKRPGWRLVIFSTSLDDLLERAFALVGQPYHLFAYCHHSRVADGATQPGRFIHILPNGETAEMPTPNSYNGHDSDHHPLIVKLCGLRITPTPDSVIVTEDQYLEYLPGQEIGQLLPATLLSHVKGRSFVFFGCTSQEWHFRLLWQRLKYNNTNLYAKCWVAEAHPSELERKFWNRLDRNSELLSLAPEVVVATINEWLDA